MRRSASSVLAAAGLIIPLMLGGSSASANDNAKADEKGTEVAKPAAESAPAAGDSPSIQSSLGKYGDPGGVRAFLKSKGITYQFSYIGEVLGNPSGGVKQGASYEDVIFGKADVDFETLAGIKGLTGHASGYSIHGRGLTGNNLQNYFVVSGIEAYPGTVLYEAWFEEKLLDNKLAIRAGNLAADSDSEFFISDTAQLFINSDNGWPSILATNLPYGVNSFPIGAPGVRVKVTPMDNLALLAAVYDGNPYGPYKPGVNSPIPLLRDPGGVNFRVQDPPFFITEAQYAYNQDKDSPSLPGKVRVGYLHHFDRFTATADPNVSLRGDDGVYGIIDQTIYRKKGTEDQGATAFARIAVMPSDRNLFDFYFAAGVAYKGLIPGRNDDNIGIQAGYLQVSPAATGYDIASGAAPLIRDYEARVEAMYSYQVVPGFNLQPDFQYIFHPGAHGVAIPNTNVPTHDAAVYGLRTIIVY